MKCYFFALLLVCLISCDNRSSKQYPDNSTNTAATDTADAQTPSPDTSSKKGY